MSIGLIGKKIGMTQVFKDDGAMEAVTVVEAGPCTVTQIKTNAKEGYNALQLGFDEAKLNQPEKGHLKGLGQFRYLREFRIDDLSSIELGQKLDVSLFEAGERINVTSLSKGKGFAGTVKRYHFAGGPKSHGQSDRHRAPGSIGAGTSPGRVWKGTRMAGHLGAKRTTVQHLEVIRVEPTQNLLLLRGSVPGANKGYVLISKSRKRK